MVMLLFRIFLQFKYKAALLFAKFRKHLYMNPVMSQTFPPCRMQSRYIANIPALSQTFPPSRKHSRLVASIPSLSQVTPA